MKRFNTSSLIAGAIALSIGGFASASAQQPLTETPAPPAPAPAPAARPAATVVQAPALATAVTQAMLNGAATDRRNFLTTNDDYKQQRFYPNSDIKRSNVKRLRVAWIFQTDVRESMETAPVATRRASRAPARSRAWPARVAITSPRP